VAWGDLDGDGDEDIAAPSFVNNAGLTVPPVFYENVGDGVNFTRRDLSVLTNENTSVSRGINIFDYNNDGKLDLYITRSDNNVADLLLINNGSWAFTKQVITILSLLTMDLGLPLRQIMTMMEKQIFLLGILRHRLQGVSYFKNSGGTSYTET